VASSPRKISLEASAATFPGFMDLFIQRDSYHHDFGFDITGGCDTGHPLIVSGVLLGGPADAAGLCPDDVLLAVDGIKASNLSHVDTVQVQCFN
jgi:predicted metalloprotease with PDZ domain